MKRRILNAFLILTSLIGYLEWGGENSAFLFQAEAQVLSRLFVEPRSVAHPFTLLPLFGQIVLAFTLFQGKPSRWLTSSALFALAFCWYLSSLSGSLG